MKYGIWNVASVDELVVEELIRQGYSALTAYALSGRGIRTKEEADALLRKDATLIDPFQMKEMDRAVAAIRHAVAEGQTIAVFGDYDVDGITATCLLTDYLRSRGVRCLTHIPGRLEEGYGLNEGAIRQLYEEGARLIVTVDCGITAIKEAQLCKELGITLVITDHHECKEQLPAADAVVDPHRPDRTYPHTDLCGVGIAFKLVAALDGDQEAMAQRYCDLYCLGTVADVMPLRGENRHMVIRGLDALNHPKRLGLRALLEVCECDNKPITASTIGYVVAPRINAAGRMEHAELAVELFLTQDPVRATELAQTLCKLNKERQNIEAQIHKEAEALLRSQKHRDGAIVLAGEDWHQGVVGIVASRLCEEYRCPAFLICLNGDNGKASSRSYGGFNLFGALQELSHLLVGYGGHELAAGFTILRENIEEFRRRVSKLAQQYVLSAPGGSALQIDCEIPAHLLTEENVLALSEMEPCGTGCARPVFCISEAVVDHVGTVGNGKHLRLRLHTRDGQPLQAIYFSGGNLLRKLYPGVRVDLAFQPTINEYRGTRNVQLNLTDIHVVSTYELYDRYLDQQTLNDHERWLLAPTRADVAAVWNYIRNGCSGGKLLRCNQEDFCYGVASGSGERHSIRRTGVCLDILKELGLIRLHREYMTLEVQLMPETRFNALHNSTLYCTLGGE
ncbi:MAG: single-stranded-DNA-specific exonuclease RecJ [Oscillospiraceae bacterium]|nr:single-stranded-DNA-specific exonuclease RecJ [Oscillospiraceae bacterium]